MDFFPVFLDLRGRTVLVLGTGPAAERKAALVARAGAEVRGAAVFSPRLLDDCALAIGADAAEADLQAMAVAARGRGIPLNVVDRPELCTAIMPAIVDRAPITIAISSGGTAPVLARLLRSRIEALIAPGVGRLATLAAQFREETVRRLPDASTRRRMLERAFSGRVAERLYAGDAKGAAADYRELLATAGENPRGEVFFIRAAVADLLTLRAARLLGEADAVVHGSELSAEVLDLARRDAERIATAEATATLIALARAGKKVVRIFAAAETAERERPALAAAGVTSTLIAA